MTKAASFRGDPESVGSCYLIQYAGAVLSNAARKKGVNQRYCNQMAKLDTIRKKLKRIKNKQNTCS